MMHGPAVRRLQELLIEAGHEPGPVDGIFGSETERAVKRFQFGRGLKQDGIVGPITWAALNKSGHYDRASNADFVSIAGDHPHPRLYNRPRSWDEITGVCLHQTGCKMPTDPLKWARLNAHYGITSEGVIVEANAPTDFIWHAQQISRRTIGIEIAGNFEGVQGDPSTLWKGGGPAASLSLDMIAAADRLFEYLHELFQRNGREWRHVYAHRQSARARRSDPGSEIWSKIGRVWIDRLGIDPNCEYRTGRGRPIPVEWDAKHGKGEF
jgi:peptidoglycan hydrolase-like protein with peptidoglycan-binding domain